MLPLNLRPLSLALTLGLALSALPVIGHAETKIADTFSLKDRGAGLPINGTATEKGAAVWEATKNVILNGSKDSGYLSLADGLPFAARVPLFGGAKEISVEASVHVAAAGGSANWLAVGIGNPKLGVPAWGNGVFLFVTSGGAFGCSFNPNPEDWESKENVSIKTGHIPEYDPDGLIQVKLVYKPKENTVSAWINDEPVVEDAAVPTDGAQLDPAYAGISGFAQQPNIKTAASFSVQVLP